MGLKFKVGDIVVITSKDFVEAFSEGPSPPRLGVEYRIINVIKSGTYPYQLEGVFECVLEEEIEFAALSEDALWD